MYLAHRWMVSYGNVTGYPSVAFIMRSCLIRSQSVNGRRVQRRFEERKDGNQDRVSVRYALKAGNPTTPYKCGVDVNQAVAAIKVVRIPEHPLRDAVFLHA